MTWLEVQITTLQKMFAIESNRLERDDTTEAYLAAMPYAANEGLQRLATVGRFIKKAVAIEHVRTLPETLPEPIPPEEVDEDEIPIVAMQLSGTGTNKYDMRKLAPSYFALDTEGVFLSRGGCAARTFDYRVMGEHILMLPAAIEGTFTVWYDAYPQRITHDTTPETVLVLHPEMAVLLPLYMASQLYKDDDIAIATVYRNEFEVGLDGLRETAARLRGLSRSDTQSNTTKWW